MKIVLATHNSGKVREIQEMLAPATLQVFSLADLNVGKEEALETGPTFIENALIKARRACELTGLPALADDSGLVVEALYGAPGVFSARYAGPHATDEENVQKLLDALAPVPDEKRKAWFYCVMVFMSHIDDPVPLVAQGKWEGAVLRRPVGNNGFGYDPVFYVPKLHKSAAQLPLETKNKLSHRAQALRTLMLEFYV